MWLLFQEGKNPTRTRRSEVHLHPEKSELKSPFPPTALGQNDLVFTPEGPIRSCEMIKAEQSPLASRLRVEGLIVWPRGHSGDVRQDTHVGDGGARL